MSFAPQPIVTVNHSPTTKQLTRSEMSDRKVKKLPPRGKRLPVKLQLLLWLEHSSSIFTFCLIGATIAVYTWTFYLPKLWSKEYKKLETLQRFERQLTETNETLKNQLAQQAQQPETGLVAPQSGNAIFIDSASNTPEKHSTIPPTIESSDRPLLTFPLGY